MTSLCASRGMRATAASLAPVDPPAAGDDARHHRIPRAVARANVKAWYNFFAHKFLSLRRARVILFFRMNGQLLGDALAAIAYG